MKFILFFFMIMGFNTVFAQREKINDLLVSLEKNKKDSPKKVDILNELAFLYINTNIDSVSFFNTQARKLSIKLNYDLGYAKSISADAVLKFLKRDIDSAKIQFNIAETLFTSLNDTKGVIGVKQNRAFTNRILSNFDDSIFEYKEILALLKSTPDAEHLVKAYIGLSSVYTYLNVDSSIYFANKAIDAALISGNKLDQGKAYSNYAITLDRQDKFEESRKYQTLAFNIFDSIGDVQLSLSSMSNIANIENKLSNYNESIAAYFKVIDLAKEFKLSRIEGVAYNNIANNYLLMGLADVAFNYYEKAAEISKNVDKITYYASLSNIGLYKIEINQFDEAITILKEVNEFYKTKNYILEQTTSLNGLVNALIRKGNLDEAEAYALESAEINKDLVYKSNAVGTFTNLAKINLKKNNIQAATKYALKAKSIADSTQVLSDLNFSSRELYQVYKKLNKLDSALFYHEIYKNYSDSIFNVQKSKQLGRIEVEYEYKSKEEKLRLENQNALLEKEVELTNQKYAILIISMLGFAAIIAIAFLLKLKREKEKNNLILLNKQQKIEESNKKLEELIQQKNRLFSIIAHDLRGPLSSLSMFLNMANNKMLTESELFEMLDEANKKLESLRELNNNLLDWASKSLTQSLLNKEQVNLAQTVDRIKLLYESNLKFKGITFNNNVPESTILLIDINTLNLLLRNLISNAIKFCNANSSISISIIEKEFEKIICIEDTGVGMTDEISSNLFNNKPSKTLIGTANEKGSGIGLMLCKTFIEENGGAIWVDYSEVGKGTKICFKVPV